MLIKNKYLVVAIVLASAAGCKQVPMLPGIGAHKIDIQQGNAVTQEMVAKLQPGMTRNQVRFALGTPLLVDPFRTDRWDYYYSYTKGGELIEQRKLTVFFKDDKLDRVEGDVIPAKPVAEKPVGIEKPKAAAAPAKPEVARPDAEKPALAKVAPAKPAPAEATAVPAAAKPEAKAEEKPKEERGFFGRMLEKIGL